MLTIKTDTAASCVRKIYYKLNGDAETADSLEVFRPGLYSRFVSVSFLPKC